MAIDNINDYAGMWANGVNIGELWDKIKAKFVAGFPGETGGDPAIDQSSYSDAWKLRARTNIGLPNLGVDALYIGASGSKVSSLILSTVGKDVLTTTGASAVNNLWAAKASNAVGDADGNAIKTSYASSLSISTANNQTNLYLKSKDSTTLSTIPVNRESGLAMLDSAGELPLDLFPDAILGQVLYGGTCDASDKATLSPNVKDKLGITDNQVTLVNQAGTSSTYGWVRFEGVYFIMEAASTFASLDLQVGDWLISTGTAWKKIDNTDAVTGVKGNAESNYRIGNINITAANVRALDTGLPNTDQEVEGNVQFKKNVGADWGMSANGIVDLSASVGGGGSGTVTRIQFSSLGTELSPDSSGKIFVDVDDASVVGQNRTNGTIKLGNIEVAVRGLNSLAYASTVALSSVTGADDLKAIEALTATSGYLKKTAANTWALRSTSDMKSDLGITGDIITHNASEFVAASAVKSLTIKGGNDTAVTYSPTANSGSTLTLKAGTNIGVTVSGSDITISNSYSLPTAAANVLGGIKVADPFTINSGTLGIGSGKITNTMLANSKFTIGSTDISLGSTHTAANFRSYLGLGGAALRADDYYVNAIGVSGDNLTYTKGSTTTNVTVPYASTTSRFKSDSTFTNQEFVYRQSPQTIDADSLVINKFKGRTVAWNQLVANGNFSTGVAWTLIGGATMSVANNIATVGFASPSDSVAGVYQNISMVENHIYYFAFDVKFSNSDFSATPRFYVASSGLYALPGSSYMSPDKSTDWKTYSVITEPIGAAGTYGEGFGLRLYDAVNNTVPQNFQLRNTKLIDLTLLFNGNVPSGYTAEDFERDFPDYPTAYNAGELRNNDAKQFESVGFNLYGGKLEFGNLDPYPEGTSSNYIRTTEYVSAFSGQYYFNWRNAPARGSDYQLYGLFYDGGKNIISRSQLSAASSTTEVLGTAPVGTRYIKAFIYSATGFSSAELKSIEFCLNKSDASKNGTYEPYRRIVTDLNLDAIQVKSHNIWDEEWELGAISPDNGSTTGSTTQIRSKNFISVQENSGYYVKNPIPVIVFCYDNNYQPLGRIHYGAGNAIITTKISTAFIKFCTFNDTLTTYNNDICINESSSFNGQYEPHGILTINGLKQAGSVYDEIVGNKLVKRVGDVDLGDLSWTYYTQGTYNRLQTSIVGLKPSGGGNTKSNIIASVYENATPNIAYAANTNKVISGDGDNRSIYLVDSNISSSDVVSGKVAKLNGVMLNYELATPIEYELASPIPDTMPAGTTERIISDRLPVTPFACDMTYGANPKDILASGVAWEKIWNRPILAKGLYSDATLTPAISTDDQNNTAWFKLPIGDTALYIKFAVGDKAFKLQVADDDVNPTVSKEFEFATLSTADINAICV